MMVINRNEAPCFNLEKPVDIEMTQGFLHLLDCLDGIEGESARMQIKEYLVRDVEKAIKGMQSPFAIKLLLDKINKEIKN